MARALRIGVVMDPIERIKPVKDTTLALCLEAARRGHQLQYFEMADLYLRDGVAYGNARPLQVRDDLESWFSLGDKAALALADLDAILMRKDPPFDMEYVYATYILERAEEAGCQVVNQPQSLRDVNEKAFIQWFPQCCAPTLISRSAEQIKAFIKEQGKAVLKPLDGMGGQSIFVVEQGDPNLNVIIETLNGHNARQVMAQAFIPEISAGDKRILVINGEPVPYALARIPSDGEHRGNLAAGGRGEGVELSERDRWICAEVGPELVKRGLLLVGLDVIGDYLTEVNVTSPTCVRELDALYDLNISAHLFDALEQRCG